MIWFIKSTVFVSCETQCDISITLSIVDVLMIDVEYYVYVYLTNSFRSLILDTNGPHLFVLVV